MLVMTLGMVRSLGPELFELWVLSASNPLNLVLTIQIHVQGAGRAAAGSFQLGPYAWENRALEVCGDRAGQPEGDAGPHFQGETSQRPFKQ